MAIIDKPSDYFNTKLYTGTGATQSITGVGFQPDWTWIKNRQTAQAPRVFDAVRGETKLLYTSETDAEGTSSIQLTSFDSDGFTVGTSSAVNGNGNGIVSWNWKAGGTASSNTDGSITSSVSASTTSGFSIVSWTGTGANATVGHGLGVAPKVVIVKNRTDATNWHTYHGAISGMSGGYITLNNTDGFLTNVTTIWNGDHSSTVVDLGSNNNSNGSSDNMIAYCFAEKQGYSKFGSYTGNGSTDGTFIYTGFRPAWVMWKRTDSAGYDWDMYDTARDTHNVAFKELIANSSGAESSSTVLSLDMLSNGFKLRTSNANGNASGGTYIYMCFAEHPFVTSTSIPTTAR